MGNEEKVRHLREVKFSSAGMPRHCSAGGCKSRDNRETRNAGITFHKLPKGATRRNIWITNSHRADSWDPQTDFVYFCSKHFTPESFELTGCSGIRRLKEDAFPTVFDFSSATKRKKAATPQRQEETSVRKSPPSSEQQRSQQETNQGQTQPEATGQRSAEEAEETDEGVLPSSQETCGLEQVSLEEHSPSPPESRAPSPSRYMRRLPPPPGFYLSKEHSYAQLCPLLWRRRYDQAIDSLEKALRQLHAARRRENRLRSTVLRLRDKRLKHTLLLSQASCKNRGSWRPGGDKQPCKAACDLEESETDAKSESTGLLEDRHVDQVELGCRFVPDTSSWSEEEKGYCFYCGRGQLACRVSKTWKDLQPPLQEDSLKIQRIVETSTCGTAENAKNICTVSLERAAGNNVEPSDIEATNSKVLLQNPSFQQLMPADVVPPDPQEQSVQVLSSHMCEGVSKVKGQEHSLDQLHQLLWIQDSAEGQVILMPVCTDERLQSFLKLDGVPDEAQSIVVSELDLKAGVGHMTEDSGSVSREETSSEAEHSEQHPVLSSIAVEMREDVREKLKEHLEGFHLQLSTEFIN